MDKKTINELLGIVRALSYLPCSKPFLKPVDVISLQIFDYLTIIDRPMDLGTIKTKITKKEYATTDDYLNDMNQIFENCRKYNTDPRNPVRILCEDLQTEFENQWKLLEDRHKADKEKDTNVSLPVKREPDENKRTTNTTKRAKIQPVYPKPPELTNIVKISDIQIPKIPELKLPELELPEPEETSKSDLESTVIKMPENKITLKLPDLSPVRKPSSSSEEEKIEPMKIQLPPKPSESWHKRKKAEEVIVEEELDYDKLTGKDDFESVIKFKMPEMPQASEEEQAQDAPAPTRLNSNEYMKAVLQPLVDQETKRKLRSVLYKSIIST